MATTTDWTTFTKHGIILPNSLGDEAYSFRGDVIQIGNQYVFSYTGGASSGNARLSLATQPVYQDLPSPINNGDAVFDFFDGFSGSSLDLSKWSFAAGTIAMTSVGSGLLTMTTTQTNVKIMGSKYFGENYVGETYARHPNQGTSLLIMEVGFGDASWNTVRLFDDFPSTTRWQGQAKRSSDLDDPTKVTLTPSSDKNWHIFRTYRQSPGTAGFQIDNLATETFSPATVPTINLPPFLMSYSCRTCGTNQFIVDWTRVRKWAGANASALIGPGECNQNGLWTGWGNNTNWHDPLNWCGGVLPDANTNVTIAAATYQPVIGSAAFCNNITLGSGATLEITSSNTLNVSGNWTKNGETLIIAGTGTVIFNGSAQTIGGTASTTFNNLTINSSGSTTLSINTSLGGNLNIATGVFDLGIYTCNRTEAGGILTIENVAKLKIGDINTLPSNYSTHSIGTASIIDYCGTDQTVAALNSSQTYGNLVLSGSGTKTFSAGRTIAGNLTIKGTAQASLADEANSANTLILGEAGQVSGIWGSTLREPDPAHTNDTYFTSTGTITIANSFATGNWLGGTSADWNTASNWQGGVPVSITNVVIPEYAAYQPVIPGSPTAACRDLTLNAGASLTINAGQALTVNGILTNNGTLTIESEYSSVDPIGLTLNGSLIVTSTSIGDGKATYNRLLRPESSSGDKHFFSSPVSGQTVSGFTAVNGSRINVLDSQYEIWEWNELTGAWQIVSSAGSFASGKGYNIDQTTVSDGLLKFTGTVVNSATFKATSPYINGYTARSSLEEYGYGNLDPIWSGTRTWLNYGGGGWNLLGNPFTSAMNAATFITENTLPVSTVNKFDPNYQALYVYDGVNSVYKYAAASAPLDPVGAESHGSYIQAGQGFFVLAIYDEVEYSFTPAMQVHNTGVTMLKSAEVEEPWPGLELKVKYGNKESLTTIVYNNEMTVGLDPGYDVGQFSAEPDVEIYTTLVLKDNSVNFARQALPLADYDKNIIPVGIDSEKGGEVTFSAYTVPLGDNKFWLEDRTAGTFTNLNTNTYTVTLPAKTYGTGRFFIIASTNTPTGIKPLAEDTGVRVWTSNDKVIIKGEVSDRAICTIYDMHGEKIVETQLVDGELNTVKLPSVLSGVYLVRVVDGVKVTTRKVAIL